MLLLLYLIVLKTKKKLKSEIGPLFKRQSTFNYVPA